METPKKGMVYSRVATVHDLLGQEKAQLLENLRQRKLQNCGALDEKKSWGNLGVSENLDAHETTASNGEMMGKKKRMHFRNILFSDTCG